MWERVAYVLDRLVGPESPYRGPILAVFTILALWLVYKVATRGLRRYLKHRA